MTLPLSEEHDMCQKAVLLIMMAKGYDIFKCRRTG